MGCVKSRMVESGERAVVRSHTGHVRVVDGPARLTLWRSKFRLLERHIANPKQYLHVVTVGGETFIRPEVATDPKNGSSDPPLRSSPGSRSFSYRVFHDY